MQPSLLKFFSRSSKPLNDRLYKNSGSIQLEESNIDKKNDIKPENKESQHSPRPRRRIIYESSDEENNNESIASETAPNVSLSMTDSISSPNPSLSAFACSSPSRVRMIDSCNSSLASPKENPKEDLSVDISVQNTLIDSELEASTTWEHLNLPFLQPEKLSDGLQRRPNHPDYDCRTLFVPKDFLAKQSPAMRQWWELKSRYADVVLLFKVGKFYELYHMDATVGVNELGLVYMRGSHAHCGFPEVAFPRMANGLVKKGYKVGRVEQTESVEAMTERTRGRPGSEKVVRREVCQLLTPGTCTATDRAEISHVGQVSQSTEDSATLKDVIDDSSSFLIAVSERNSHNSQECIFGVSLLNAVNGMILLGQFTDDSHYSRLRTLFAHYPPSQVLVERGSLGHSLKSLLKTCLSGVPVEQLARGKQFWTAKDTISELETAEYFSKTTPYTNQSESRPNFAGKQNWPVDLLKMLSEDDPLGRSVKPDADLAVSCLGAVIYYLRYCLIDREVLSLGYVETYVPPDVNQFSRAVLPPGTTDMPFYHRQPVMVLDSITLGNLDILQNTTTGTREGTLIERLDNCCTPFGRRLFRQWLTAPPCNPVLIRRRQDAVENLMELLDRLGSFREGLRRLPDFERLITKIHLLGSKGLDKDHPDNRAILFEEVQYSRKNILDFVATLDGFEFAYSLLEAVRHLPLVSEHLKSLVTLTEHGGTFPSLQSKISYFKNAFDVEKAKRDGRITPEPGVDADYDAALAEIKCINDDLAQYLMVSGKRLGVRLVYWGTARNRFQIEVPDSSASRVPHDWRLSSQRKGFKRYRTSETQDWLNQLMSAEERKDVALRGIMRTIFTSFSQSFSQWHLATKCLAELDCLLSLAIYSVSAAATTCRPEFVELSDARQEAFLDIEDGLHPCLINTFMGGDLIPNSVRLGSPPSATASTSSVHPLTVLVTGPNMGGKSTLMRQTALLVILAHLGCRVPAASCRLTPVDRIFSRLGASDRLLAGESTFLVELSETAAILRHATRHSLVLMDELGRGTSTHDGAALASAVLRYLANPTSSDGIAAGGSVSKGPRTLFSTHYHTLVDEVAQTARDQLNGNRHVTAPIGLGHMACMVEEQANIEPGLENITFLYKFIPGACPKSYGFNAARLAHLPDKVIQLGLTKAKEFERTTATFACLRTMLSGSMDLEEVKAWRGKLAAF